MTPRLGTRPGWGTRHPAVAGVLGRFSPVAIGEDTWGNGTIPLREEAYFGTDGVVGVSGGGLPDEVITSIRCLVRVGEKLVVCTNRDGISHPWPGGRRKAGETFEQTAVREVKEETGWLLEPESFQLLGWLHLQHMTPRPADWPYPNPDFCQIVGTGIAVDRVGGVDVDWTDEDDGYEASSALMTLEEAERACERETLAGAFIRKLRGADSRTS